MKKLFSLLFTIALAASLVACGSVNITAVNLSAHKLLNKGDTIQLTPAFASEKEKNREKVAAAAEALTLEWATSNESVATVDGTGLVTAVGLARLTSRLQSPRLKLVRFAPLPSK